MPENKQIHDLPIAEQTSSSDLFETEIPSQLMQSGYASRKVSAAEIADLLLNNMTYPQALQTTAKKIIPAINEAAQSGGGGGASANEALPYDENSSYEYGDYCIQNNYLWRCIFTTTVTGAWDATKWIAVLVTNEYKRVRIMNKAAFDLLSADEKDGFIYVSDYPTKIQDIDNVSLTTSDNNKLLGVSVSGSDISVGAVDLSNLIKIVFTGNISKTLTPNQNIGILGTEIIPTASMPSGYTVVGLLSSYSTNNNCIMYSYDASAVGTSGTFCFIKNNTASSQSITVNYRIVFMKSAYVS